MLFNSVDFLIFFPIVTLIYFLIPYKIRYIWLLVCSYYFYMCWNAQYALLLFASTFVTWLSGIALDRTAKKEQDDPARTRSKGIVAISLVLNLTLLFFFKYANFTIENLNALLARTGVTLRVPKLDLLLPVGISFYIFQALSYTIDVYRGDVQVERNLLRYMVFVSFFPQLVAGPIERSSRLLGQFYEKHRFSYDRTVRGLLLMLWGYFQKMVVADRLSVLVDQVFNYSSYYQGFTILVGALFFAVQIYCDFAGYSTIAVGAAQIMGFDLMENFHRPYFAVSVADFWRRWHISLTTWFRDYLYIPLGGNRKGKWAKYRNIMIVFLTSGLWHGANWTYVIWGGLNGLYQIIGAQTQKLRAGCRRLFGIRENTGSARLLSTVVTFLLVDFSWIFFRAATLADAVTVLRQLFSAFNPWVLFDGTLYTLGLSRIDFWVGVLAILTIFAVDWLHEKNVHIRDWVLKQNWIFRWVLYFIALFAILIFGFYGPNYDAAQFIYFQF